MKLLFISSRDVNMKFNGGFQCTNRNYLSFCDLLGAQNVKVINLNAAKKNSVFGSVLQRIHYMFGFADGLSSRKINYIVETALDFDYIFIDTSTYGVIAFYLKKNNLKGKIICFFHNIEYKMLRQQAKINPFNLLKSFLAYYNERKACQYADKIIVLNKRDGNRLKRQYGRADYIIIPISLSDSYTMHDNELTNVPPTIIFIGNLWYANIHGLKWFIENVLKYVNIKLQIVGFDMGKLKRNFLHPNIEFLGYVPDLSTVLAKADYVISPIFLGGGMKVKTCESLMYGKNIIGTQESFEGYEIDYNKAGVICNNKEEFIYAIEHYCSMKRKRFNEYNRECFLKKYSFHATLKNFNDLINK